MERMTHKKKTGAKRLTRKRNQTNQNGGASLVTWPAVPSAMVEEWKTALEKEGLTQTLPDLFEQKTNVKAEHMELWFRILENQDELFDAALQILLKKAGVDTTGNLEQQILALDTDTLEKIRDSLLAPLLDVRKMVKFNANTDSKATKLSQIIKNKSESLISLFLFPKRLHNMFLESLAGILVSLGTDSQMLEQLTNPTLVDVAAAQYRAYVLSNIMMSTGTVQRDGYFLDYPVTDIKQGFVSNTVDTFYSDMLGEILRNKDTPFEELFRNEGDCSRYIDDWSWGILTAHIFLAYKFGSLDKILTLFDTECTTAKPRGTETRYYPEGYDDVTIRGVRFGTLLSNMSYTKLQYILHLSHKIKAGQDTGNLGASNSVTPPA